MYLRRYIHRDGHFQIALVDTTQISRQVFTQRPMTPIALQLLSQTMTGALLLASQLKDNGTLQVKFSGDGPIHSLSAEANTLGHVRGVVDEPAVNFEPNEASDLFTQAIGAGRCTVKRRMKPSDKIFESHTMLEAGGIAFNLVHYLLQSQQVRASMRLSAVLDAEVGIKGAGGIMLQALPGANENLLFIVEDRLAGLDQLGEIFAEQDGHDRLAAELFESMEVKYLGAMAVCFRCECNRQRVLAMFHSLSRKDLEDLRREQRELEVKCGYCDAAYTFTADELATVIATKD
jgi:molecular chaperone Hsp33